MLNSIALANSFTIVTALLYLLLSFLKVASPIFFRLFLNSQFFGADIASQTPKFGLTGFFGALIAICLSSWIFGYFLGKVYNRLIKV